MKVRQIELPGVAEPEGLRLRERELPPPGAGQVLVRVEATGVSFAEQQMRRAKYYDQPPFPFVPGYDLVGVVEAAGAGEAVPAGTRVAALTKTGGWADHVLLDAGDVTEVPDGLDAAAAETVIVNGITARRMLRAARVRPGQTIVVLGANGGVGSVLTQMARADGVRVLGVVSGSHAGYVRELGAEPIERTGDVERQVRALAPDGVAAVFDHVGGPGIATSWRMVARGGTLVSYGTAATKDASGKSRLPVLELIARLTAWRVLPNGRRAVFFNLWAGRRNRRRFQQKVRDDLAAVFALLGDGTITAEVARTFPLDQAGAALRYAESGAAAGKVVLVP